MKRVGKTVRTYVAPGHEVSAVIMAILHIEDSCVFLLMRKDETGVHWYARTEGQFTAAPDDAR